MPCRKLQRVTRERKLSSQSSLTCRKLHIGNKVGLKRSSCKKALLFFKRVGGNGFDSHIRTTKRTGCLLYLAVLVQQVLSRALSKKKIKQKTNRYLCLHWYLFGPLYTIPGCFLPRVESQQRVLKINTSHQPGLSVYNSMRVASSLTQVSLPTDQKLKIWTRKTFKSHLETGLLPFATNSNIFTLLFKELKTNGKSFIFAV